MRINSITTDKRHLTTYIYLAALNFILVSTIVLILFFIRSNNLSMHPSVTFIDNRYDNSKTRILAAYTSTALCVLIRVHSGHISYLPVLALALNHTGFDNIHLYVINIDKNRNNKSLVHIIQIIDTIILRTNYITLLDVGMPKENDFGFTMTDRALTFLYKQYEHSPSLCQYVIMTNGDNLYSKDLGMNVLPYMNAKKDIIAWNFVSRYYRPGDTKVGRGKEKISPEIVDNGTHKCIEAALRKDYADLGTAAYRVAFLKQHRLHIHYPNGTYDGWSDGAFAERAASLTDTSIILRQTLFVHQ